MTLNWEETASRCQVVKFITPYVERHAAPVGSSRWEFFTDSPLYRTGCKPLWLVEEILATVKDYLPEDSFWNRTRHRLSTDHGRYAISRDVNQFMRERKLYGDTCLCGTTCRYPEAP